MLDMDLSITQQNSLEASQAILDTNLREEDISS